MRPEALTSSGQCPYTLLPATNWWGKSVAERSPADINPHLPSSLHIDRETRVGSAGSCFAQHISRALIEKDFNYFVVERSPANWPPAKAQQYGFGTFSARYGNIYTTLQLLQLTERALGTLTPVDRFWTNEAGRTFDLLRPRIMPLGFASRAEAEEDEKHHLAAVRRLIRDVDVFVFTLGLTECWISRRDGTVYPTCPGCGSAGRFDPSSYVFENLSVARSYDALARAVTLMTNENPNIQIILTVSPVPLAATMEDRHVLQASTYSKSVLRVVAEEAVRSFENVHYFASYEIITGTRNTGGYFGPDGRTISSDGIAHAMSAFFEQFSPGNRPERALARTHEIRPVETANDLACDEDAFFRALARSGLATLSSE